MTRNESPSPPRGEGRGEGVRGMLFVALALAIVAAGCVTGTQREGRVIDPAKVARIKVGQTTKQEVLDLLGPPAPFAAVLGAEGAAAGAGATPALRARDEDVYTYEYREENERFFSVVLLYTSVTRVRLADTLMVVFDAKDVVKYVAFAKQTDAEPEPPPEAEK